MRRRRLSVKLESNMGKCIVEREMSQRTLRQIQLRRLFTYSQLFNFVKFPQESIVLINGKDAVCGFFICFFWRLKKQYLTKIYLMVRISP